jgi:hypothetical protein
MRIRNVVPGVDPSVVREWEPEPLGIVVIAGTSLEVLLILPLLLGRPINSFKEGLGYLVIAQARRRRHSLDHRHLQGRQLRIRHGREFERDVSNDTHEAKAATGDPQLIHVVDGLQLAMGIDILNFSDKVAQSLVATSSTMADGRIATTQRNLDYDDVEGDRDLVVFDAPAPKPFIGGRTADTDERVSFL